MIIHILAYFSIGLLDFVILIYSSSLHIWDSRPQSVIWNANIFFSYLVVSHFVFDFLCCAEVLSLIRPHMFSFSFISFVLGDRSEKILLWFMSMTNILVFSSRSFIVSHLTFRHLIHLEMFNITSHVAICNNMGRFWGYYAKWNKSE